MNLINFLHLPSIHKSTSLTYLNPWPSKGILLVSRCTGPRFGLIVSTKSLLHSFRDTNSPLSKTPVTSHLRATKGLLNSSPIKRYCFKQGSIFLSDMPTKYAFMLQNQICKTNFFTLICLLFILLYVIFGVKNTCI